MWPNLLQGLGITVEGAWLLIKNYWIVPAGMLALYYYGRFHFNTPDYALERKADNGLSAPEGGRLLSPAPPRFTTSRTQYNRYAWRYIAILQVAFLVIIFLTDLVVSAAKIGRVQLTDFPSDSLEQKALWSLFALTGLLSSFPLLKDVDAWLLKRLHQAALVPDVARDMAEQLFASPFEPGAEARTEIAKQLKMRDTIRVANGTATGALELRLLQLLWLRHQLRRLGEEESYRPVRTRLNRDFSDITQISQAMQDDITTYFEDQAAFVPGDVTNLDDYIANPRGYLRPQGGGEPVGGTMHDALIKGLRQRRKALIAKCDALYYRLCLLAALMQFATATSTKAMNRRLRDIGFGIEIRRMPVVDWNAAFAVTVSVFAFIVASNVGIAVFNQANGIGMQEFENRSLILTYSVAETAAYAIALVLAMWSKGWFAARREWRHWPAQNAAVAVACFLATALYYMPIEYALRGDVSRAPLLYALNQGAMGFFIGFYIDRALKGAPVSLSVMAGQAAAQLLATAIGVGFVNSAVVLGGWMLITALAAFVSAVNAVLIAAIFQPLYRQAMDSGRVGPAGLSGTESAVGDLYVRYAPQELPAMPTPPA